jgi:hypothetical protein
MIITLTIYEFFCSTCARGRGSANFAAFVGESSTSSMAWWLQRALRKGIWPDGPTVLIRRSASWPLTSGVHVREGASFKRSDLALATANLVHANAPTRASLCADRPKQIQPSAPVKLEAVASARQI